MLQARLGLGHPWIGLRRISRSPLPHPSWPSLLVSDQLSLPSLNPRWRTPNRSRLAGPRHRGRWWGKLGKGGVGGYEQIHEYNYAIVLEIRKSENSNPWIVKKILIRRTLIHGLCGCVRDRFERGVCGCRCHIGLEDNELVAIDGHTSSLWGKKSRPSVAETTLSMATRARLQR